MTLPQKSKRKRIDFLMALIIVHEHDPFFHLGLFFPVIFSFLRFLSLCHISPQLSRYFAGVVSSAFTFQLLVVLVVSCGVDQVGLTSPFRV